jgi:undecaprenyl-diphosphatase
MSALHAFALAILQGVTELFPISSLGHVVIVPALLGWPIDQHSPEFLPFVVVLHVGTAVALLLYFWRDWWGIGLGFFGFGSHAADARHALWLIVIATLPAVVIGFFFEKLVRGLFASPLIAALFLIANGFLLLLGDWLRNRGATGSPVGSGAIRSIGKARWRSVSGNAPLLFPASRAPARRWSAASSAVCITPKRRIFRF